jgi:CheY-like chemotaxis protein
VLRLAGSNAEAARKAREIMERQLYHMVRLVDDLLDISRVTSGKMELRRARVQLADFDMFSQVDRSVERSTGGLGIGLALVKGLVQMHGGEVLAESPGQGRGSTFFVRLPLARSPLAATASVESNGRSDGPSRRVLVLDDSPNSASSMAAILELLGHKVETAGDGLAALEAAERFRPELILMDVGMPNLNGYDATRRIRARPWGTEVTIVAVTGWGQEGDRARSRLAGCDGHLVKPVQVSDLDPYLASRARERREPVKTV